MRVTFQGNATVTAISTTGKHERTNGGSGVGSTEQALRSELNVRCETLGDFRHCYLGQVLARADG